MTLAEAYKDAIGSRRDLFHVPSERRYYFEHRDTLALAEVDVPLSIAQFRAIFGAERLRGEWETRSPLPDVCRTDVEQVEGEQTRRET